MGERLRRRRGALVDPLPQAGEQGAPELLGGVHVGGCAAGAGLLGAVGLGAQTEGQQGPEPLCFLGVAQPRKPVVHGRAGVVELALPDRQRRPDLERDDKLREMLLPKTSTELSSNCSPSASWTATSWLSSCNAVARSRRPASGSEATESRIASVLTRKGSITPAEADPGQPRRPQATWRPLEPALAARGAGSPSGPPNRARYAGPARADTSPAQRLPARRSPG
jgi:hypothetical protein